MNQLMSIISWRRAIETLIVTEWRRRMNQHLYHLDFRNICTDEVSKDEEGILDTYHTFASILLDYIGPDGVYREFLNFFLIGVERRWTVVEYTAMEDCIDIMLDVTFMEIFCNATNKDMLQGLYRIQDNFRG